MRLPVLRKTRPTQAGMAVICQPPRWTIHTASIQTWRSSGEGTNEAHRSQSDSTIRLFWRPPHFYELDISETVELLSMTGVVIAMTRVLGMTSGRLTKLEIRLMETLWTRGEASIREMQEAFPEKKRPGYTTVQKTVYRMEAKKLVRRVRKLGNFHLFAATVSRDAAQRSLVDDLLAMFGGQSRPVVAHLIGAGKLTLEDVEYAERTLKEIKKGGKA